MTPTGLNHIADKYLDRWFADGPYVPHRETPTLREYVCDAMREALAINDRNWADGNATLRHERDVAQAEVKRLRELLKYPIV